MHRDTERDGLHLGQVTVGIRRGIALVRDDDGIRAAVPGGGEIPLEAPRVEVLPERGDEEDGVDVCRHHLRDGAPPGLLARERRAARQDRLDDSFALAVELADRDPVSRHGQVDPFELSRGEPAYAPVLG